MLFEYPDCSSCDRLHDQGLQNPAVRRELARFDAVQLNLFGGETIRTTGGAAQTEADWARSLGITYAPTIVLFDAARREVLRIEADLGPAHLLGALRYVSSGSYRNEPRFQRYVNDHYRELRKAAATAR